MAAGTRPPIQTKPQRIEAPIGENSQTGRKPRLHFIRLWHRVLHFLRLWHVFAFRIARTTVMARHFPPFDSQDYLESTKPQLTNLLLERACCQNRTKCRGLRHNRRLRIFRARFLPKPNEMQMRQKGTSGALHQKCVWTPQRFGRPQDVSGGVPRHARYSRPLARRTAAAWVRLWTPSLL